jgi:hypothetical protein
MADLPGFAMQFAGTDHRESNLTAEIRMESMT